MQASVISKWGWACEHQRGLDLHYSLCFCLPINSNRRHHSFMENEDVIKGQNSEEHISLIHDKREGISEHRRKRWLEKVEAARKLVVPEAKGGNCFKKAGDAGRWATASQWKQPLWGAGDSAGLQFVHSCGKWVHGNTGRWQVLRNLAVGMKVETAFGVAVWNWM